MGIRFFAEPCETPRNRSFVQKPDARFLLLVLGLIQGCALLIHSVVVADTARRARAFRICMIVVSEQIGKCRQAEGRQWEGDQDAVSSECSPWTESGTPMSRGMSATFVYEPCGTV